jgi:hypothetical protein
MPERDLQRGCSALSSHALLPAELNPEAAPPRKTPRCTGVAAHSPAASSSLDRGCSARRACCTSCLASCGCQGRRRPKSCTHRRSNRCRSYSCRRLACTHRAQRTRDGCRCQTPGPASCSGFCDQRCARARAGCCLMSRWRMARAAGLPGRAACADCEHQTSCKYQLQALCRAASRAWLGRCVHAFDHF